MLSERPIGVFDSGLGGLTVLRELQKELPNEDFIYLGDVARLPYGSKSQSVVRKYAGRCAEFLLDKGVKWIVIACNTATAMALEPLKLELNVGISGVIEPGVRAALSASSSKQIVVMATRSTVGSEAYLKEFSKQSAGARVEQVACPLLVPLAEEGWFEQKVTEEILCRYLEEVSLPEYDVCLMGCTHYPLLEKSLRKVVPSRVHLVHSGFSVAQELKSVLSTQKLLKQERRKSGIKFYATDEIAPKLPMVSSLFGNQSQFEVVDL
jgi:glutamate racemase